MSTRQVELALWLDVHPPRLDLTSRVPSVQVQRVPGDLNGVGNPFKHNVELVRLQARRQGELLLGLDGPVEPSGGVRENVNDHTEQIRGVLVEVEEDVG